MRSQVRGGELFGFRSWLRPTPRAGWPGSGAAAPAPPPNALPHRRASGGTTARRAWCSPATIRVLTVREGEMLDDNYRVESIKADGVTLVYFAPGRARAVPVTATV